MTYERWQELTKNLQSKFPDAKLGREDLPEGPGQREWAEFTSPLGRLRVELWIRPELLERKTLYSHRMNTAATVQYKYDETEHTLTLKAFRWDAVAKDWQAVNAEALSGSL